jgi:hypothetical protein
MARHWPDGGAGLFYGNAQMLSEISAVQSATYDAPDAVPARAHVQVAERIMDGARSSATRHERNPVGRVTKGMTSASGHARSNLALPKMSPKAPSRCSIVVGAADPFGHV